VKGKYIVYSLDSTFAVELDIISIGAYYKYYQIMDINT